MSTPLDPEERAFWRKRTGLPGEVLMAQVVARLLAERDSLERERDEAREQVRSLTVERDAARADTGRVCQMLAEEEADSESLRAQLSRAREALADFDEEQPHYRAGKEAEDNWRARQESALAALRAALAEPLGGP